MRTGARIVRSFGMLLMRRSVIRSAERTANGTKQHYNLCVADDSAGCVSYANVLPHHRVWSVYIVREVRPHRETRKKYIGAGRGATTRNTVAGATTRPLIFRPLHVPHRTCTHSSTPQAPVINVISVMPVLCHVSVTSASCQHHATCTQALSNPGPVRLCNSASPEASLGFQSLL
jgi:hypothetical protein